MKILILSWRGPKHPNAGGAEIVTHEYAKYWVESGHKVTLFTSSFENGKEKEDIDGVKIIREGGQILGVQMAAIFWYLVKNKEKFDLVIDHFHGIPFFTPLFVRIPKLAFIHETAKEVWMLNHMRFPFNLIYGLTGRITEPWIFRLFYRSIPFLTVSNSTKKDLKFWGIDDITVINNGINSPKVKLLKKPRNKIITFFGSLSRDKGIETAIKVFSILQTKDSSLKFWIIGKGESKYLKGLKNLAKTLDNIKFWGFVSEDQKYKLLAQSAVVINPSIWEGWGLTVIEAASVGTPTIAFDVPGLRDSIKDKKTGILVKDKSPEAMADEVLKNIDNKKILQLSKNALVWSKKFDWQKSKKESLKLINALI